MPLQSLLYISRADLGDGAHHDGERIRKIAETSAARNREVGLTGCLIFAEGHFAQVLEGPIDEIEVTFERICCDFRHVEVRLVDLVPIKERQFGEFRMASLYADGAPGSPSVDELNDVRFTIGVNAKEAVHQMRTLLDRKQNRAATEARDLARATAA